MQYQLKGLFSSKRDESVTTYGGHNPFHGPAPTNAWNMWAKPRKTQDCDHGFCDWFNDAFSM